MIHTTYVSSYPLPRSIVLVLTPARIAHLPYVTVALDVRALLTFCTLRLMCVLISIRRIVAISTCHFILDLREVAAIHIHFPLWASNSSFDNLDCWSTASADTHMGTFAFRAPRSVDSMIPGSVYGAVVRSHSDREDTGANPSPSL